MPAKELAEKKTTELAQMEDFEGFAGAGMEDATSEDFAIPFVSIIQSLSPQRNKQKSEYIEGANEGMIFNSVSQKLFDGEKEGIRVVPCHMLRSKIEWGLREDGGGFKGQYPGNADIPTTRDDRGREITADGTQIVDTMSFYVLVMSDDGEGFTPAVISMSSTQLKKGRRWMTMLRDLRLQGKNGPYNPPMFSHIYKMTTVPESNDQGSWYGWKIERERPLNLSDDIERVLFTEAKDFYEMAKAGSVNVAREEPHETTGSDAGETWEGETF